MADWSGTLPTSSIADGNPIRGADIATIRDAVAGETDPWVSYTPVITATGWSQGNAVMTGAYKRSGKDVQVHFEITGGSTTTWGTGAFSISLPIAANHTIGGPLGTAQCTLSSSGVRLGGFCWENGSASVAISKEDGTRWTGAVPITFTSGSELKGNVAYEGA